ncbi:MAG: hypothetical protein WC250_00640 [Candidatus Paceibacterota bacterium]|jgi:hypothetical protein
MNETEISEEQLERLKWVWAYFQSLEQTRAFLGPENFPTDSQIRGELDLLRGTAESLFLRWHRIFKLIHEIQSKCCHQFLEHRVRKPGESVLTAKVCKHCKLIVTKPLAGPTQICAVCWAPMKSGGISPGCGSRVHYYECTNPDCRHSEERT